MQIQKTLRLNINGEEKIIYFGNPTTQDELMQMYSLRYRVYVKKGFIDPNFYPNGLDKDNYDDDKKSIYFIASIDKRVFGAVRLIRDIPLPTENIFKFSEPDAMKKIAPKHRAEVSRLVVEPYDKETYLPRNLTMLFLFGCVVSYAKEHGIIGGYSFVKKSLLYKLKKIKTPISLISSYTMEYPVDGVLYKYFTQKENPAVPVFFYTENVHKWAYDIINSNKMFKCVEIGKHYILKENFYNAFLRKLNII